MTDMTRAEAINRAIRAAERASSAALDARTIQPELDPVARSARAANEAAANAAAAHAWSAVADLLGEVDR